jgi:flagellar hook-associated protein 3 FlgL
MFRVTQHSVQQTSLQGLYGNMSALQKLQQQLSSGTRISQPSDDPTGTNTSILTRQASAAADQHARNITDGAARLDATDSTLQNILDQVRQVRDLTVQGLNTGAVSPQSQNAIQTQVNGIRQSLIGQANTVVQNQPVFGGVTNGGKAYDGNGTYIGLGGTNGISQPVIRRVSDVETIRVDVTGPEAFGDKNKGQPEMFSVIANVAQHVAGPTADPAALANDLADLDKVISGITSALADVGTRAAQMETAKTVNASQQLSVQAKLQDNEGIDMPKTIMNLQMQQVGYQAALAATAQSLQPTLIQFLK